MINYYYTPKNFICQALACFFKKCYNITTVSGGIMSAGDDMRQVAKETLAKVAAYRDKSLKMRQAADDIDRAAADMEVEAKRLEREARQEDERERRAEDAIEKAENS